MASPFIVSGRFDLAAIMREAVVTARRLRAGGASWRWRMRVALKAVWSRAKNAMAEARRGVAMVAIPSAPEGMGVTPTPAPKPRMMLDRTETFRLLSRIQAHPMNRGRNFLADTVRLGTSELLTLARSEFRVIPHADRPAILDGIKTPPRRDTTVRSRVFVRGSRILSHGW